MTSMSLSPEIMVELTSLPADASAVCTFSWNFGWARRRRRPAHIVAKDEFCFHLTPVRASAYPPAFLSARFPATNDFPRLKTLTGHLRAASSNQIPSTSYCLPIAPVAAQSTCSGQVIFFPALISASSIFRSIEAEADSPRTSRGLTSCPHCSAHTPGCTSFFDASARRVARRWSASSSFSGPYAARR